MDNIANKMQAINDAIVELEAKAAKADDEAKRAVYADEIKAKAAEFDALKAELDNANRRKEREGIIAGAKKVDDSVTSKLDNVSVPASDHNQENAERAKADMFWRYLTLPCEQGGKDAVMRELGAKSVMLDEMTPAKSDLQGLIAPRYLRNLLVNPIQGKSIDDYRRAMGIGAKGNDVLTSDASGVNSGGGSLVPDLYVNELYRLPQLEARLMDYCRVKTAVGGTAYFPKLTQSSSRFGVTAAWGNEGAQLGASEPAFTRTSITTKRLGLTADISDKELRVNNVSLQAELSWMFRGAFGEQVNKAILNGASGSAFTGINTATAIAAGVTEVARATAATIGYADLNTMLYSIENAAMNEGMWVVRSGATGAMRTITGLVDATTSRPIFSADNLASPIPMGRILGAPVIMTPDLTPTVGNRGDVIFGAWRNYGIAVDQDITVDRSEHLKFDYGLIVYRVQGYLGGIYLGASCFAVLGDESTMSSSSSS